MSNLNQPLRPPTIIVDVDLPLEITGALIAVGATIVVGFRSLSDVSHADVVLVIITIVGGDSSELLRSAKSIFAAPPLLALVDDETTTDSGSIAIEAGADYILPRNASANLITGVYFAARRRSNALRKCGALEIALRNVSDSVEVCDATGRLLFVNRAFEQMTGYDADEVMGKSPTELLQSDVHDAHFYSEMWNTVLSGQTWSGSLIGRRKNGALVAQLATVRPISDETGTLRHIVAVKQFLPTEHHQHHHDHDDPDSPTLPADQANPQIKASIAALASSERRYRTLVEAADDAIVVIDFDSGRFLEVNPAAVAMFGYEADEFRRLTPRQIAGVDASEIVDQMSKSLIATGKALEPRHPFRRKDGSQFFATTRLTLFELMARRQYVGVMRDVSAEVAREEELARSHHRLAEAQHHLLNSNRLAALGQMAAGIAHEINNPLQYILAGIDDLGPTLSADPDHAQIVADMREGAERIRSLSQSLLPFARVDNAQTESVNLNEVVEWATRVSGNELRHRAELELHLSPIAPILTGHRTRIEELVTNLLANAMESIDDLSARSTNQRITVTTMVFGNGDDRRVRLIVQDTGQGIPDDMKSRVFDPFFTTKSRPTKREGGRGGGSSSSGTGLSLALCAEIVVRHGGVIDVESTVGFGSRFIVTFAAAVTVITGPPAPEPTPAPVALPPRSLRVLVIDDEEALIRTYKRSLRGFDVVAAVGGKAAIEILSNDLDFDAILCDLMMPNVDGPMVHAYLAANAPQLVNRVLFCSGGAFTSRVRGFIEGIPNLVLDKPVSAAQLRAAIEKLASTVPPPPSR